MVFPLLGTADVISPFGVPRDGGARHHLGNDVAASHLQPVVAVAGGTISRIAGDHGISGNRIHIRHDDGWSTLYIHLNNDTAGTDDGNGTGMRPDLSEGDRVEAGEVIGWNGDSGNAEGTVYHLHFELRDPSGTAVDPAASLAAATRLPDVAFQGPFADLAPTDTVDPLILLLSRGVPVWCETPYTACPDEAMDQFALQTWFEVLVGLQSDPDAADAEQEAGTLDCETEECPGITELDLARYLAWVRMGQAFDRWAVWLQPDIPDLMWTTPPPEPPAQPDDLDPDQAYQALGGPSRCLPRLDDETPLTRRQAASALLLYLGWDSVDNCPTSSANR
ncbi:MAG TPA: M23 family metallopeptidase [Acidimicrobiia bacterium]|nr:M23 family metallopeptidase [Acidimicrobiia bacterium]